MGPIQVVLLVGLLVAPETVADVTVILADDDRGLSIQKAENIA